ncbi:hypothetical protein DF032_09080 [Burkholderia seminalis]|nr:hypothetical protein DF032_09080 [Burkholderia seminalis]
MQDLQNVERTRADAQRRALAAYVALLEIHRQRSDLDHGRLRVPRDDSPVNAAAHRAGSPRPARWARRTKNVEFGIECRHTCHENLER